MNVEQREAKHGEKMIEIKVRFWTDQIAPEEGHIKPRHCWDSGLVRIKSNKSHGLEPQDKAVMFRSLMDIARAIEDCFTENGIKIHLDNYSSKYIDFED